MKKGLGKGLGALITSVEEDEKGVREIRINEIEPNKDQPRKHFDGEKLAQLAESIKQHGVVQPLIVKKEGNTYKIVTGERRWRASKLAGLKTVPAIVREFTNKQVMEVALIENLQREDLNPIEEAEAYEKLLKEYKMTQEEISAVVGRSRPTIANSVRLLSLPDEIKSMIIAGEISSGHARALLVVEDKSLQLKIAEEIVRKKLNVREIENLAKKLTTKKTVRKKEINAEYESIEERFREILGTKVKIMHNNKKGKILIEYYSEDELDRILNLMENSVK